MRKKLLVGLIASLCVEPALADSSSFSCEDNEVKVVKASKKFPLYKVGTCLKDTDCLILKEKEWVELQYHQESKTVMGPYPNKGTVIKTKCLIKSLIERFIRLLGSRAPNSNCGVWDINPLEDSAFCFVEPIVELNLCRVDTSRTDTLVIENRSGSKQQKYDWRHGNHLIEWPLDQFPVNDGDTYLVIMQSQPRELPFHQVPQACSDNNKNPWITMVDKGCFRQAEIQCPK